MNIRERLQKIPELNASKRLMTMTDYQIKQYIHELNTFIDNFPLHEKELRASLEKKDVAAISRRVLRIRETLVSMGCDDLAAECWKYINGFDISKFDRVSAYITFFLSTLTALSIDVQMAIFLDKNQDKNKEEEQEESDADKTNAEKIILAVDDDPMCLDLLRSALQEAQCKLICATSGSQALNMMAQEKPNLFILDIYMPEMDGIELAKKIRETAPKAPIVFITGNADKNNVIRAASAGGADFILKPINPGNVVSRIKKFL
jgi:CheY-like chemotaxis protein